MGFLSDNLRKNLAALRKVNPARAEWIESAPEVPGLDLIKSADGEVNLLVTQASRKAPAYELVDPWAKPRRQAAEVPRNKEDLSLVVGFGLGYLVRSILEIKEPGHPVVVVEPHGHLARLALELHDYSIPLEAGELVIAGPGEPELIEVMAQMESQVCRGAVNMVIEDLANLLSQDYLPLTEQVRRLLNQINSNFVTVSHAGQEIAANEIVGLPGTSRCRGVAELHNLFQGQPAILVSTGPSLGKNIHLLREAQDRAVIIAMAQALRSLLAYGVTPDFICTIDFGVGNLPHFEGIYGTEDVPIIALCRANNKVIRDYQGTVFVSGTHYPQESYYLGQLWRVKGILNAGNSVAHLAFSAARLMGADPIIFVGQDLAFGAETHFDQVDHNAKLEHRGKNQFARRIHDPQSQYHQQDMGTIPLLPVPGYYGGQVMTNAALLSFISLFERLIQTEKGRYINATEGGARIKGADPMSLKEVIEKVLPEKLDKTALKNLRGPAGNSETIVDQIMPFLKAELDNLKELKRQARRGLATNRGLSKLSENPDLNLEAPGGPFQRLLQKNAQSSNGARDLALGMPLTNISVVGLQHRIMRRDLNVDLAFDKPGTIRTRLERNKLILSGTEAVAKDMIGHYEKSIDLLSRYLEARNADPADPAKALDLGRALEEMGDFEGAAKALHRATDLAPADEKPWAARARLAVRRERYAEAEECLDRLTAVSPFEALRVWQEYEATLSVWLRNEKDLEVEMFARPLVNLSRYLQARPDEPVALDQKARAEAMREKKIEEALAEEEKTRRLQMEGQYQDLLAEARRLGQGHTLDGLNQALKKLRAATEIFPERPEARLGYATTCHHVNLLEQAEAAYRELVRDFPDNKRFQFELGLVLLKAGKLLDGLREIERSMAGHKDFDNFLPKMGDMYLILSQPKKSPSLYDPRYWREKALSAYDRFLNQYQVDFETWTRRGDCLFLLNRRREAEESYKRALAIKPDFRPALDHLAGMGRLHQTAGARPN